MLKADRRRERLFSQQQQQQPQYRARQRACAVAHNTTQPVSTPAIYYASSQ